MDDDIVLSVFRFPFSGNSDSLPISGRGMWEDRLYRIIDLCSQGVAAKTDHLLSERKD